MTTNNINMIDLAEENFSFSTKAKRLAEEIRIPVMITSVTLVGNEVFKAADGKETVSYKIGIGFTSNVPHVSDAGEEIEGFHEFYAKYTASTGAKSALFKIGLVEACGLSDIADLSSLVNSLLGKKISAMTKYRKYKTKTGEDRIAVDLEKFKALTSDEDFSDVESVDHVPFTAQKFSFGKKIVLVSGGKAHIEVLKALETTKEPVKGTVDIDEVV